MKLVIINEDICFAADQFASVQKEVVHEYMSISCGSKHIRFKGSVISLKNGRKIYAENISPEAVIKKINESLEHQK